MKYVYVLIALIVPFVVPKASNAQVYKTIERSSIIIEVNIDERKYVPIKKGSKINFTLYRSCKVKPIFGKYEDKCIEFGNAGAPDGASGMWVGMPILEEGEKYLIFMIKLTPHGTSFVRMSKGVYKIKVIDGVEYMFNYFNKPVKAIDEDGSERFGDEKEKGFTKLEYYEAIGDLIKKMRSNGMSVPTELPQNWRMMSGDEWTKPITQPKEVTQ